MELVEEYFDGHIFVDFDSQQIKGALECRVHAENLSDPVKKTVAGYNLYQAHECDRSCSRHGEGSFIPIAPHSSLTHVMRRSGVNRSSTEESSSVSFRKSSAACPCMYRSVMARATSVTPSRVITARPSAVT